MSVELHKTALEPYPLPIAPHKQAVQIGCLIADPRTGLAHLSGIHNLTDEDSDLSSDMNKIPAQLSVHKRAVERHGFRLVKQLGASEMSKVFLALNLDETDSAGIAAKVAIKIIEWQMARRDYLRIYMQRLLKLYSTLPPHRNIVPIKEQFSEGNAHYVVMEYYPMGSLASIVRPENTNLKRGLAEDKARDFFLQICRGLMYLHQHGIPHGHLTCENVLVTDNYKCMLMDFGYPPSVCTSELLTPTQQLYAAPEFLRREATRDFYGDIWSVGIILFVLLNGGVPYTTPDLKRLKRKRLLPYLTFKASLSFPSIRLMRQLLSISLETRPSFEEILGDPWITGQTINLVESFYGKLKIDKLRREDDIRQRHVMIAARKDAPTRQLEKYDYQAFKIDPEVIPKPTAGKGGKSKRPSSSAFSSPMYAPGPNTPALFGFMDDLDKELTVKTVQVYIDAPKPKTWQQAHDNLLCLPCRAEQEEQRKSPSPVCGAEKPGRSPPPTMGTPRRIDAPRMEHMMPYVPPDKYPERIRIQGAYSPPERGKAETVPFSSTSAEENKSKGQSTNSPMPSLAPPHPSPAPTPSDLSSNAYFSPAHSNVGRPGEKHHGEKHSDDRRSGGKHSDENYSAGSLQFYKETSYERYHCERYCRERYPDEYYTDERYSPRHPGERDAGETHPDERHEEYYLTDEKHSDEKGSDQEQNR